MIALAERPAKVVRVGFLSHIAAKDSSSIADFLHGMRERGYVESKNLIVDYRSAEGQYERLPALAAELVKLKPDVIVASTSVSTRAAQQATATIPIVMVAVADPVEQGFVKSFATPGGNITGVSGQYEDLVKKMPELLKAIARNAWRMAVLVDASHASHADWLRQTRAAAEILPIKLLPFEVNGPEGFDSAFSAMRKEHPDALLVFPSPKFFVARKQIVDFAQAHHMPAVAACAEFTEAGGLISYGLHLPESFRRAATYVDKILKGAKPGDLPVEQPTQVEMVINLRTAKALELQIPQSLLLRADKVIE
ncbi:MAG: ABC transporter substrate-binding protein [Burkholderiales bacterium]|nr:ABC transporter substrate-binding protein [Burkholderiales bacterium]